MVEWKAVIISLMVITMYEIRRQLQKVSLRPRKYILYISFQLKLKQQASYLLWIVWYMYFQCVTNS